MFRVTTQQQTQAGQPCEEYASESRAEQRARELVALGKGPACFYWVDDDENWPESHRNGPLAAEQDAVVHGGRREAEGATEARETQGAA